MESDLFSLLNLLEEEFRASGEIRVSPVFPSGTERSIDLPQDYDPNSAGVHRIRGVKVRTRRKEYFFPEDWLQPRNRALLYGLIDEIRESQEPAGIV